MAEYTYEDIIMDPNDPRLEGAIGKKCYFADCPKNMIDRVENSSDYNLSCLTNIRKDWYHPFISKNGTGWALIILKKEEPKPKPEYIPFENLAEFLEAHGSVWECLNEDASYLSRNGIWLKDKDLDDVFYMVTEIWRDGVVLGSDQSATKWDDLLDGYTFPDGTPCGKLAEEDQ